MAEVEVRYVEYAWHPHHEWASGFATGVDGYLVHSSGKRMQLDIATVNDPDWSTDRPSCAAARYDWGRGQVWCWVPQGQPGGVKTLLLPYPHLTSNRVNEAIRRFTEVPWEPRPESQAHFNLAQIHQQHTN